MSETNRIKIIPMIILIISTCIYASALNHYAIFGDNTKMFEAKIKPAQSIYNVGVQSLDSVSETRVDDGCIGSDGRKIETNNLSEDQLRIFVIKRTLL